MVISLLMMSYEIFWSLRQQGAEHDAARGGLDPALGDLAGLVDALPPVLDLGVEVDDLRMQRVLEFGHVAEDLALAGQAFAHDRHVIEAEHDVLRRHDDRLAVRGVQDVVGRHHQDARFELRFQRQRNVHGHLVAVEVGVERRANQRMQLDRLAFDQAPARTPECRGDAASARGSSSTGCSRMTSSRISQTSGRSFSTSFFACFTVVDRPLASSRE